MGLADKLFPDSTTKRHQVTTVDLSSYSALQTQVRLYLKTAENTKTSELLQSMVSNDLKALTYKLAIYTPSTILNLVLADLLKLKKTAQNHERALHLAKIFGAEVAFEAELFDGDPSPSTAYQEFINRFYLIPQGYRVLPKKISSEMASYDVICISPNIVTPIEKSFAEGFFSIFAEDFIFVRNETEQSFTDTLRV